MCIRDSASDPSQPPVAAELVASHATTPWESLMLAVDFKGATVITHQVEATA